MIDKSDADGTVERLAVDAIEGSGEHPVGLIEQCEGHVALLHAAWVMQLVGRGKEFEELGDGLHGGRADGSESFGRFDPEPKIVVVQERFQSSDSGSSASAECGQGLASPVAGLEVL